ncbi:putative cyclin-dependent serine/threonine-protein kinase DDB_G0272797/DDB_G0274007 [Aplysia californica]|uniref:Cyclin-dependent serine/threonine-protein kinase DDB_G0272797/DDB_G0274007 n=1 Tax=Aplysia californica TaxID=6500 RepID=A0ABM1VV88_APLCA|nr:putative cyclin-dependent serine/threonine-protein kinase DDB_G0272797/DDB_G0274007 [Aplysia californica]
MFKSILQDSLVFPSLDSSPSSDLAEVTLSSDGLAAPTLPAHQRISPILRHKSLPNRLDQPATTEGELSWRVNSDCIQQQQFQQQQQMRWQLQQQQQLRLTPPHGRQNSQLTMASVTTVAPRLPPQSSQPSPYQQHSLEEIHQLHQLQQHQYHHQQMLQQHQRQQQQHQQQSSLNSSSSSHGIPRTSAAAPPQTLAFSQRDLDLDLASLGLFPLGQQEKAKESTSALDLKEKLLLYVQTEMARQNQSAMDRLHSSPSSSSSYPSTPVKAPPAQLYHSQPTPHPAQPYAHRHQPSPQHRPQPQSPGQSHGAQHKAVGASSLTRHRGAGDKKPLCFNEDTDDDWEEGEESLV